MESRIVNQQFGRHKDNPSHNYLCEKAAKIWDFCTQVVEVNPSLRRTKYYHHVGSLCARVQSNQITEDERRMILSPGPFFLDKLLEGSYATAA